MVHWETTNFTESKINHYSVKSKLFQTFIYITFCKMGKEEKFASACFCSSVPFPAHVLYYRLGSSVLLGFWFLDLHVWKESEQVLDFGIPFTLLSTTIHQECICKVRVETH